MGKIKKAKMKLSEKLINVIVKYFAGILLISIAIYAIKGQLPTLRYYIMFVILGLIVLLILVLIVELTLRWINSIKDKKKNS